MANILSFSRIAYILPANESLGPMQISLSRMIDVGAKIKFLFSHSMSVWGIASDSNSFILKEVKVSTNIEMRFVPTFVVMSHILDNLKGNKLKKYSVFQSFPSINERSCSPHQIASPVCQKRYFYFRFQVPLLSNSMKSYIRYTVQ